MYAKVFRSMWDGTLGEHWPAWTTFVFMLANADPDGVIDMTPEAISRRSSLPLDVVKEGIRVLEAPDPASRSPEEEGRRIVPTDPGRGWGWQIVNYRFWRGVRDAETIRAQTRERVRRHREAAQVTLDVTHGNARERKKQKEIESSPPHPTAGGEQVAARLPLRGGGVYEVHRDTVERWRALYPSANPDAALRAMLAWLTAHPARRKTRRGMPGFFARWLAGDQREAQVAPRRHRASADRTYLEANRDTIEGIKSRGDNE